MLMRSLIQTGRTPVDCMRNAITRQTHTWTAESDATLVEAVNIYGTDNWMLGIVVSLPDEEYKADTLLQ